MAVRGRKPTPPELRLLETPKGMKPRGVIREAVEVPGEVTPPASLTPAARHVWAAYAPTMIELKLLTVLDSETFALYCEACATFKSAHDKLQADDIAWDAARVLEGQRRWAADTMTRLAKEFGLTPQSRRGLPIPARPNEEDNSMDQFLQEIPPPVLLGKRKPSRPVSRSRL